MAMYRSRLLLLLTGFETVMDETLLACVRTLLVDETLLACVLDVLLDETVLVEKTLLESSETVPSEFSLLLSTASDSANVSIANKCLSTIRSA